MENEKCCFCREKEGVIPLVDKETLREIFICNSCDWLLCLVDMGYNKDDMKEMDNPKVVKLKQSIKQLS